MTFSNIFSGGAFPAVLPDMARSAALADWQLGIVAGAFGFARMVADVPLGLFLTHHLRRALWVGPLVLVLGALCVTAGGGFTTIVLGRLLMGLGQALSMVAGLTAILRFQSGKNLASALAAYELSAMIGMLEKIEKEKILGKADVREVFRVPRIGAVAGCMVIDGIIRRNARARLIRDGVVSWEGSIASLRRFKDDVSEVREGFECGIGLENFNDVKVSDQIEAYVIEKVAATEL